MDVCGNIEEDNIIIKSAKRMKLDKREKGDTKKIRSYKGLLGRWFEGGAKSTLNLRKKGHNDPQTIKRGAIISIALDEANNSQHSLTHARYLVICVFKVHGSKWHPSLEGGEDPSWPLMKKDLELYRLLVREVVITKVKESEHIEEVNLKPYEEISGIEQARRSYRLIKLGRVSMLHFYIDH
jgi:hypothetical protein